MHKSINDNIYTSELYENLDDAYNHFCKSIEEIVDLYEKLYDKFKFILLRNYTEGITEIYSECLSKLREKIKKEEFDKKSLRNILTDLDEKCSDYSSGPGRDFSEFPGSLELKRKMFGDIFRISNSVILRIYSENFKLKDEKGAENK